MKLWLVATPDVDYDEYDAFVIRAKNSTAARKLAVTRLSKYQRRNLEVSRLTEDGEEGFILSSYNAG